ncbi:putative importin 11 [Xylariaceae sp. FL0255]|nr:putative importin 11 [Xylariaceae sp. FL0255]
MNFAIEVPGAASPLSRVELCRVLQSASLHDTNKRQAAGQQLSSWESDSDYYPALQTVFLDNTLPREIRLLAIIQLKNGIDRFWRHHTIKNAIPPAEKHMIRSNLFRGTIEEPDQQLALHNALVLAKIARIDFPDDWPECLDDAMAHLTSAKENDERLGRALIILLRVVKELGSARLRKSQTALQASTPALLRILCEIYGTKTSIWIAALTSGQAPPTASMNNSLVAFKILRRLMTMGYEFPHRDEIVRQVWTFSQAQFGQLLPVVNDQYPIIGKHLLQFTKLHIEMADSHPASFCALPDSVNLVRTYWDLVTQFSVVFANSDGIRQTGGSSDASKSRAEGPLLEKLALKGLLLIRSCIKMTHKPVQTIKYRSKEDVQEQKDAVAQVKAELFTEQLIGSIVETIITQFFLFRKADMEAWEEDPQEWEHQEESQVNAYEWEIRPCAEKLFMDILIYYGRSLLAPLLTYFARLQDPQTSIIDREAIYTAMGIGAHLLHDVTAHLINDTAFEFDPVLRSTVVADVQQNDPLSKILRRRIAILLSQWAQVRIEPTSQSTVYEIFRRLLVPTDPANDIVVRITAARQFKAVVDDFSFDSSIFQPFAPEVLKELLALTEIAEVDDTKLAITETLRSLITRMETGVTELSELIISALPSIWDAAGEMGHLMKQAVLAILQNLVIAMRTESQRYHHLMAPLIAQATEPESELRLYLMDDALELWSLLLQQSQASLSSDCLNLANIALAQLGEMNEFNPSLLSIVGSYLTLAPQSLLDDPLRDPLLRSLSGSLDVKDREQIAKASEYIQLVMTLSHKYGGIQGFQLVMRNVMEIGLLRKLLEGIHDAYDARQTSGPKRRSSRLERPALNEYLSILARIALIDPATFMEMIGSVGAVESVWTWLSDEWFYSFDTMSSPTQIKLNVLGTARLLELPQPTADLFLPKLQDYISTWTGVITQLWTNEDNVGHDTLVWTEPPEQSEWDTPKDMIERELAREDPVHTQATFGFTESRLKSLRESVGAMVYNEWISNVDKSVVKSYYNAGNGSWAT